MSCGSTSRNQKTVGNFKLKILEQSPASLALGGDISMEIMQLSLATLQALQPWLVELYLALTDRSKAHAVQFVHLHDAESAVEPCGCDSSNSVSGCLTVLRYWVSGTLVLPVLQTSTPVQLVLPALSWPLDRTRAALFQMKYILFSQYNTF
ncbi:hypothetical protein J6590_075527 [Homalodisca vitripennis]|nr:hypothetical protein J6590_075527 [Homalodisca vitripennis]